MKTTTRTVRSRTTLAVAAAAVALGAGAAFAAIPGSNGVINGCYGKNGTLRVIDAENGESCNGEGDRSRLEPAGSARAAGPGRTAGTLRAAGPEGRYRSARPPGTARAFRSRDQLPVRLGARAGRHGCSCLLCSGREGDRRGRLHDRQRQRAHPESPDLGCERYERLRQHGGGLAGCGRELRRACRCVRHLRFLSRRAPAGARIPHAPAGISASRSRT